MAGIVFGCVVPHPPIMVPEIGGGREGEVSASIQAMREVSQSLSESHPQSVLIVSPHGASHYNAMGVLTAKFSQGNLMQWGASSVQYSFENDPELASAIAGEAKTAKIPVKPIGERGYDLDHGVMVPMYFLAEGIKGIPVVPLTFCWQPLKTHYEFGNAIRKAAERAGKQVAFIASGDLSHRLLPGAPAGYDPMGQVFDRKIVDALATMDVKTILNLNMRLVERAGECGLRSICILLGALEGLEVKSRVHSYEGPFGVGYVVASFEVA